VVAPVALQLSDSGSADAAPTTLLLQLLLLLRR
jgi:hypothetical protein